ncbi:hypothetical protein CPC08DRAFT_478640 [Agrocybe pediades]|nr:hypothetical protein CPC08DRAFT_478640 [Agrocybe pediades]
MRQYCESVLAVLYSNLSDSGIAHFVFGYYHLLHNPHSPLPRKLPYVDLHFNLTGYMEVGTFGETIINILDWQWRRYGSQIDGIINLIFNDLTGGIKKEAIFAKSASFCLSVLCDESNAKQDADRIYGIARHDRRKKREHPWRWRQIVPRPPSLGNRLALITFDEHAYWGYSCRLTRIRKASPYRYPRIRLMTLQEYFHVKSKPRHRSDAWDWNGEMKDKPPQHWPLYVFLIDLLPHILPLAGRDEPLIDVCRRKCFSSLSQFWPKKSRRARRAIDNYLRRMDSLERL